MKASEFKTKQAIKNQIYRTIQSLTSKIYRDEDWSNVFHLVDRIKEEGVEVSCFPNGCGGYRSNNEGQQWKEYKVEMQCNGFQFDGLLICAFCGTVENPYSAYDMSLVID